MQDFIFALLAGMGAGGVYALLGTGLVIAFRGSGVINFAHGAVAAYTAYTFNEVRASGNIFLPWFDILPTHDINLPVRIDVGDTGQTKGVIIALLMAAFLGALLHFLVFRPLRNAPVLGKVIGSVGALIYLQAVALLNFGNSNRNDVGWWEFRSDTKQIDNFLGLGNPLPRANVFIALAAVVVGVVFWALYRFTRFGLATRAAEENEKGAVLLGYSPQLIALANWVISSLLAGFAGLVFAYRTQPPNLILLVIFALGAALVGNLNSLIGATIGGLVIGMVASAGVDLTTKDWWPAILPGDGIRNFIPLLFVIAVLYIRGDKIPVRGSVTTKRQPKAPATRQALIGATVPAVIIFIISAQLSGRWESSLTTAIFATLFMLSLTVIVGFVGQISLAQWSLAGVAAFTMIRLSADGEKYRETEFFANEGLGLPGPLAALGGVIVAVLVGVLIGLPALRIRGVQLAVVTIASVIAIQDLVLINPKLMGEGAIANNPSPEPNWFGMYLGPFDDETGRTDLWRYTAFLAVVTILVGLGVANLRRGATGRRFLAVRSNERAAAAAGIDVARTKLLGFAIGAAIAGIAGVMFAYKVPALTATGNFDLFAGLALFAFVYLGGITTVYGAVVGGLLVAGSLIPEFLGEYFEGINQQYIAAVGAIGLIVTAILNPEGMALANTDAFRHLSKKLRGSGSSAKAPVVAKFEQAGEPA